MSLIPQDQTRLRVIQHLDVFVGVYSVTDTNDTQRQDKPHWWLRMPQVIYGANIPAPLSNGTVKASR